MIDRLYDMDLDREPTTIQLSTKRKDRRESMDIVSSTSKCMTKSAKVKKKKELMASVEASVKSKLDLNESTLDFEISIKPATDYSIYIKYNADLNKSCIGPIVMINLKDIKSIESTGFLANRDVNRKHVNDIFNSMTKIGGPNQSHMVLNPCIKLAAEDDLTNPAFLTQLIQDVESGKRSIYILSGRHRFLAK